MAQTRTETEEGTEGVSEAPAVEGVEPRVIHFLEDGFTALEKLWYRGEELTLDAKTLAHTVDRAGNSWTTYDEDEQMTRLGKVFFRDGPWPGEKLDEDALKKQREASSGRGRVGSPGFLGGAGSGGSGEVE